jgi:hypothetical protein
MRERKEKQMRLSVVLLGSILASPGFAGEYPLPIESDITAQYFVVQKGGGSDQPFLLLKRVRPGGTSYSKRLFDCEARTYQTLGSWERPESVKAGCPDSDMRPVKEGSIAYQLWQHACGE